MYSVSEFSKNPLVFLRNNILIMGFESFCDSHVTPSDKVEHFKFLLMKDNQAVGKQLGEKKPVYQVIPCKASDLGALPAYWCPYKQNDVGGVVVGQLADFMFTATMTGCTLGVGSQAEDGGRLVYHSNLGCQKRCQVYFVANEAKIGRRIESRAPGRPRRNASMAKK